MDPFDFRGGKPIRNIPRPPAGLGLVRLLGIGFGAVLVVGGLIAAWYFWEQLTRKNPTPKVNNLVAGGPEGKKHLLPRGKKDPPPKGQPLDEPLPNTPDKGKTSPDGIEVGDRVEMVTEVRAEGKTKTIGRIRYEIKKVSRDGEVFTVQVSTWTGEGPPAAMITEDFRKSEIPQKRRQANQAFENARGMALGADLWKPTRRKQGYVISPFELPCEVLAESATLDDALGKQVTLRERWTTDDPLIGLTTGGIVWTRSRTRTASPLYPGKQDEVADSMRLAVYRRAGKTGQRDGEPEQEPSDKDKDRRDKDRDQDKDRKDKDRRDKDKDNGPKKQPGPKPGDLLPAEAVWIWTWDDVFDGVVRPPQGSQLWRMTYDRQTGKVTGVMLDRDKRAVPGFTCTGRVIRGKVPVVTLEQTLPNEAVHPFIGHLTAPGKIIGTFYTNNGGRGDMALFLVPKK